MTSVIGVANLESRSFKWNDVYYNDDLATGNDDGTSEADAWQSLASMLAGVKAGDRVNMKKTASAVVLSATATFPAGGQQGAIWYRGYGSEIGDGTKWVGQANGTNNFVADNGPQLFTDINFTGSSTTNYVFLADADDQCTFYKCSFSSDSAAECLLGDECAVIACSFTNTGTFSTSGYQCHTGNAAMVNNSYSADGPVIETIQLDESECTLIFGCTVQASAQGSAQNGIEVNPSFNESAFILVAECSVDGASTADGGIVITDTNSTHESWRGMAYNAVWSCDDNVRIEEVTVLEWPCMHRFATGDAQTNDWDGFGDWEDLYDQLTLSVAPWSGSGDFAPNATAGGGAVLRSTGDIGFYAGTGTDRVEDAFTIGGYREGTDDGGDASTLTDFVSGAGGAGLSGRDIGLIPVSKLSDVS